MISDFFEIGRDKVTDKWFVSKLRLINKTLVLVTIYVLLYIFTFTYLNLPTLIWPCAITFIVSLFCFVFTLKGWFNLSRIVPQLMVNFTIAFYHLAEPDLEFLYYFFPLIATIFTTFQVKEWKKYLPVLLITFVTILLLIYSDYQFLKELQIPPFLVTNSNAFSITLSTFALGIILNELISEDYFTKRDLERESKNLSGIIENTNDAIWLINNDGALVTFNRSYKNWIEKITGIQPYEGMHIRKAFQNFPSLLRLMTSDFKEVFDKSKELHLEKQISLGNFDHTIELALNPIIKNGAVVAISCFSRDITDRKSMEKRLEQEKLKAEEASNAKSWFLSNMSHELRTPLNAISGVTQIMERDNRDDGDYNNLRIVKQSTDQLLVLINDILDLSKIEAGKLTVHNTRFKINEILELINNNFSQKATEKGIDLVTELDHNLPTYLYGERYRLLQILNNLVSNALKFTNQGYVKVHLENKADTSEQIILKGTVEDTGIGISENEYDKLFEDFKQIDENTTRNYEGTGLGLSITKKLVTLLGGTIELTSQEGVGTKFFFEIPLGKVSDDTEENPLISDDTTSKEPQTDLKHTKVLMVEDNELNIKVGTQILKRLNAIPHHAKEGQEALDKIAKENFDVILLDIHMPSIDGLEVAKRIRDNQGGPTPTTVPIVIMSADVSKDTKEKARQYNVDDFIEKPIQINQIAQTINNLV